MCLCVGDKLGWLRAHAALMGAAAHSLRVGAKRRSRVQEQEGKVEWCGVVWCARWGGCGVGWVRWDGSPDVLSVRSLRDESPYEYDARSSRDESLTCSRRDESLTN